MEAPTPSLKHVQTHQDGIAALCRNRHVRRLDLFGSTACGEAKPGSDYDFVVEFEPLPQGGYATAYFGLLEDLQTLLGAPVELIVERAIRNPYFRQSVNAQRQVLYAA